MIFSLQSNFSAFIGGYDDDIPFNGFAGMTGCQILLQMLFFKSINFIIVLNNRKCLSSLQNYIVFIMQELTLQNYGSWFDSVNSDRIESLHQDLYKTIMILSLIHGEQS